MPRLQDSLQITIKEDEPQPEPSPEVTSNAGGSDMPNGKPLERDPVIDRLMDDDELPLEDSLPIDEPEFVMKPPPKDEDLFEEPMPRSKSRFKKRYIPWILNSNKGPLLGNYANQKV